MNYGIKKTVNKTFEDANELVKEALQKEGFGVLTTIDVRATMKAKLNIEFDNYVILGACNPDFAHKALVAERDIGLLLPCNIIIYEKEKEVFIAAIKPSIAMSMVTNDTLIGIAKTVEQKLQRVIDTV